MADVRTFARGFQLIAHYRRPGSNQSRELTIGLLLSVYGRDAALGSIAPQMRYAVCNMRGARIGARYVGRRGDGRS